MADAQRVEIGFEGGQVIQARLAEEDLKDLRAALEKGGWHDLHTEDGVISQDEHRHHDKEIQTMTDETVKHIDDALAAKDKEIMQV